MKGGYNMKFYYFETQFRTLKEELRTFLIESNIYFELSATGYFCGWIFAIKCSEEEKEKINVFLDRVTIYHKAV